MTSTMTAPSSTGIGAPGTNPAPASLANSAMAHSAAPAAASAIPFTRGSSLATMQDASITDAGAGTPWQVQLQTNAFMENLIVDISMVTASNAATVAFDADAPWSVIQQVSLNDPANQAIITPISGYGLYLLNKYLPDTSCAFDPKLDPNYSATSGAGATGGSFSFRIVIPVENRRRDAFGALANSAANQRYLLTINWINSFASLYSTAPTTEGTLSAAITQQYWTSPPKSITTSAGSTAVQPAPTGLGTVGFVRYEEHNEVSGGGSPQMQLSNVGDMISTIIFVLRDSSGARDINYGTPSSTVANWPPNFAWWVNDFQLQALTAYGTAGTGSPGGVWAREMARMYRYHNAFESAGGLDNGVYVLPYLFDLLDTVANFGPANQMLPTDATTKLQIRGSQWGSGANKLQVFSRSIKPVSGAALFG
jgi:hypothetical protein